MTNQHLMLNQPITDFFKEISAPRGRGKIGSGGSNKPSSSNQRNHTGAAGLQDGWQRVDSGLFGDGYEVEDEEEDPELALPVEAAKISTYP